MISHRHKLIFIHIPKCAGRSISDALGEPFDHYIAAYYYTHYAELRNDYTTFTTVRNPYGRLVSAYHYIKSEPFHAHHAITNYGNMLPFKEWVLQNISAFNQEFDYNSAEGARETDGDIGSPFWFSSQSRRISDDFGNVFTNIHLLRYEDGINAVEQFLHQQTDSVFTIAHLNNSHNSRRRHYLSYYDDELLSAVNAFAPFVHDCKTLGYQMIDNKGSNYLTA